MRVVWDLCSGLGGWSEAFVQAGWTVIRIENNPELQYVPHTYDLDVLEYHDWMDGFPKPDLVLASPPCLEFSNAYNAPRAKARREGIEFKPDMRLLHACKEIIELTRPRWWIIENVSGASYDFQAVLGPQRQIIGPFHLWGVFPFLPELKEPKMKNNMSGSAKLASNKRAMIPFELSFNLLDTWNNQLDLMEWI